MRFDHLFEVLHRLLAVAVDCPGQHKRHLRLFCRLNRQVRPFLAGEPPQPYKEIASSPVRWTKVVQRQAMMHHTYTVQVLWRLGPRALADRHHRDSRQPRHVVIIGSTQLAFGCSIKGKWTVQGRDIWGGKGSHKRIQVQVCSRGQVGMYHVKSMLLEILYRTVEMIVGFQMRLPGLACCQQRLREKGDKLSGCLCITWSKQRHLVPLRDLFLDQRVKHILSSPVILRRNSDPGRGYLRYLHVPPSYATRNHPRSVWHA